MLHIYEGWLRCEVVFWCLGRETEALGDGSAWRCQLGGTFLLLPGEVSLPVQVSVGEESFVWLHERPLDRGGNICLFLCGIVIQGLLVSIKVYSFHHLKIGNIQHCTILKSWCNWKRMNMLVVYHLTAGGLPSHCWWSTISLLVVYHLTAGSLPSHCWWSTISLLVVYHLHAGGLPSHCWWSTMSLLVVYHLNAGSLPSHCWWSTIL